jgi:hypothetical protein
MFDTELCPSIPIPANPAKGLVKQLRVVLRHFEAGELRLDAMATYANPEKDAWPDSSSLPFRLRQRFSIASGLHGYLITDADTYFPYAWHVLGAQAYIFRLMDDRGYGLDMYSRREKLKRFFIEEAVREVLRRGL